MTGRIIILRPQPGADATAMRAQALGLEAVVLPLFSVEPIAWTTPDPTRFDALMLTSANAFRHAGPDLLRYTGLPLYVVGAATARAAIELGLAPHHIGEKDVSALIEAMRHDGRRAVLHLCGEDVVNTDGNDLDIKRVAVYRSAENGDGSALIETLRQSDIALVHSPRAGRQLNALVSAERRNELSIIAISQPALAAVGTGWSIAQAADSPTDAAMLALASELCHKSGDEALHAAQGSEMDNDIPTSAQALSPPRVAPKPRKSRTVWSLIPFALAFVGGIAATIWAAPAIKGWFATHTESNTEPLLQDNSANPADDAHVVSRQSVSDLESRLAAVSAKLDSISRLASDAGGNAGRAEALLIAFAARRSLDRGAPLGYLEGELRLRFADAQPRAVATIINAAASPVTIADLQTRLDALAPAIIGTETKTDWWTSAKQELSSLIIVRKAGAPSAEPQKVLERAENLLSSGRVDAAIKEIERLPSRSKAEGWLQMARQYNEARRALDVIEAAAILEPKRIPLPQAASGGAEPDNN